MEFGLLAAAVASLAAAWVVLRATESSPLFDTLLTAAVVGMLAGRIGAMIIAGTNPLTRPFDILIVRGGVDTMVASAGALVLFGWVARHALWATADAGCLAGGTCLGTPSDLPWAWAASGGGVPRHPTEFYAALGLALATAILLLVRRRLPVGAGAAGALVAISAVRLATEPLRVTIDGGPWWWYAAGVAIGGGLLVWRSMTVPTRD
jgi:prolipoprotein diacylglyceryltransferase